jgi:signal transduction histidine kinase
MSFPANDTDLLRGFSSIRAVADLQNESALKRAALIGDGLEVVPTSILICDAEDRVVFSNAATRDYFPTATHLLMPGTPFEELLRAHASSGYVKDIGTDIEAWIAERMASHRAGTTDFIRAYKDSRWSRVVERCIPGGGIIGIRSDITDLKRREEELQATMALLNRSQQQLAEAQRLAGVGSFERDLATDEAQWSDEMYKIYGVERGNFIPTREKFLACIHSEDRDRIAGVLSQQTPQNPVDVDEFRIVRPDGMVRRILQRSQVLIDPADGHVRRLGVTMDVTDQRENEEQQHRLQLALQTAKTAAEAASLAKSMFLANMSHELRTPLNAIIGFSQLIKEQTMGPVGTAAYVEYADHINTAGEHLHDLLGDILDISKIDSGAAHLSEELVDPTTIIRDALATIDIRAKRKSIAPETRPCASSADLRIHGDELRLRQVLMNLVSNAVKFTPEQGHISVTLDDIPGAGCSFVVADDGIGMSAEEIQVALEPFGQVANSLSRSNDGAGLGLPLARRLIELHGGRLEIESEKGKGTTVRATIPESRVVRSACSGDGGAI